MKQRVKKLGLLFMVLILILNMFNGVSKNNNIAHATDIVDINQVGEGTQIHQEGCDLVIKKTQETEWSVPRKPIDLVILQDTSGSFKNTIGGVKAALKTLTTPVKQTEYDPDNPRLVFTDTPETSDRVMVGSFQGLDGSITYDKWYSEYDYNERVWKQGYRSDTNFKKYESYYAYNPGYKVESTDLIKDSNGIHKFIDNMETEGGTPTVPALEEVLAKYKSAVQNSPEKMKNERKTVFLLITDGVANGVRRPDGKVVIEYSGYRQDQLIKAWGLDSSYYGMEASQNILARAKELTEAGKKLKNELGSNSSVVVGFWEDVNSFKKYGQYGDAYLNGYAGTGVNMNGDTRSVQEIFSSALRDVASPDKVVNGKPATFYVNEQNDINAFADKVLTAVGNALVKENVKGKFKITDGYKVKSVSINGKQIVDNVTDKKTQIKGEVKQNGNDVEISVPDAAFNPGKNKFDYELSRTEEAPETDEEDEVAPDDNYTPGTVERQVGELVGHFSVGDYQTAEIGSKGVKTVKVNELKYCYPNVKKSIKDQDPSNDRGSLEDPILTKRTAYAANLNTVHENFEYTVEYRMNNIPLNMKKNAMLVDPLNYRFDFLEAYVTDESGAKRPDFNIRTTKGTDPQTGKENTIVVADIPKAPGTNTETVKEGEYGAHKFKKYTLHVKVKFKDEYPFETNQSNYIKILQENDGLGPLNQAFIKWNGDSNSPTDETASVRRSNNVFVVPPVETNIEKKVRGENQNVTDGKEHYDLPLREDKFIYDIKSGWPGLAKKYVIEDTLKDELEIIKDENNSTKYDVNVLVNNKPVPALQKFVKVEGNKVKLELQEKDITRSLNIRINLANKGNLGPALIHIQIKAKIRDGANLDKYRDQNGVIKIPNISTVILNDNPKDSNIVTVTPDEPTITKKINETLDHLNIPSWEKQANAYNYNIKTALPSNIRDYGTYKVEDVLDQDLELQEGQQPFIKGSAADHFDVSYDSGSRKITAKIKDGHFNQVEGKSVVELVIPAKIKDGATREKIPNKAKVIYNKANATGEPKELETPPVTVTPPPTTPEITKKVNDKQHVDLQKLDEEFTYKVETTVPHNATNFEITDTIKDVLEFVGDKGNVKAKVDGEDITDVKTEGKTLTVKLSEDQVKTKGGKAVVIEFKAKLKNGVTQDELKNYISEDKTVKVPNTAEYKINLGDRPELKKETPPVTVTPPPTTPEITKKVNDQEHVNLQKVDEEFTYKVETTVPHNATKFEVTDTIKDVLDFSGEVKAKVDGEDIADVKTEGKTLTVKLSEDQVKTKGGKAVVIEFKAKLKNGVTQDELKNYISEDKTVKVPNTAEYKINLGDRPELKKETPPVTVTPPPTTPEITKKVNGANRYDLSNRNDEFTYTLSTQMPANANKFEITDTIKDVLEFVGDKGTATVKIDGKDAGDKATVTVKDQTILISFTEDSVKSDAGKAIEVTFKSKIRDGANLSAYIQNNGKVEIPNKASYDINNDPKYHKDSNEVPVTPPSPKDPGITKKVNDKEHADLQKANEEFIYKVETTVPQDKIAFEVNDTIKDVLEFVGDVKATVDGEVIQDVKTDGQKLTVKLSEDQVKTKAGKAVVVEFKAKIKDGANLSNYVVNGVIKVPNEAAYKINNDPEKKSNTVTVTPPPSTPDIKKAVNGKEREQLTELEQEFTYTIDTKVPTNATAFSIFDTLENVLEFRGDVTATLAGKPIDKKQIKVNGQTVTVELTQQQVFENPNKDVHLEFKAKIRKGADLTSYIVNDLTPSIPNKAKYRINNNPGTDKDSNIVPVIPPSPKPPKEGEKSINSVDSVDERERKTSRALKDNKEKFRYDIGTDISPNGYYKQFSITDELEKVLVPHKATIRISGDLIKEEEVLPELKKLKDKLKEHKEKLKELKPEKAEDKEFAKAVETAEAELTKAKTELDKLKKSYNEIQDKDSAEATTAKGNVVKAEKAVEAAQAKLAEAKAKLAKANKPEKADEKVELEKLIKEVEDKIKEEEKTDKAKAVKLLNEALKSRNTKGEISDELAKKLGRLEIKGNKVEFEITDRTILKQLEGRKVTLSIYASIKEGADLSKYRNNGVTQIPNKAVIRFDHKPKVTNEVYVLPKIPPTIPPKTNIPPKKVLPKTGEHTNNLEWLGVMGIALILLRKRYSK